MDATRTLLRVLQLTDSSFPTGGYAFSHGLEGLFSLGYIVDEAHVRAFAQVHIEETLGRQELPSVRMAFEFAARDDLDGFLALDRLLTVLKPVPAYRNASARLGRSLIGAAIPLFPSHFAERVAHAIGDGTCAGHHAPVFGIVMASAGLSSHEAEVAFAASSLSGYVASAVRLGVIGQSASQRIISGLEPALEEAIDDARSIGTSDLGGYAPLIDIAGMNHPDLPTRLFAS